MAPPDPTSVDNLSTTPDATTAALVQGAGRGVPPLLITQGLRPGQVWTRAGFFNRLAANGIDLCLTQGIVMLFLQTAEAQIFIPVFFFYFIACDHFFKRSLGKMFVGLHYYDVNGNPPESGRLLFRGFMRVLGPFAILSWRKTSILDLFSGLRVFNIKTIKIKKPKGPEPSRRQFSPVR